MTCGPLLACLFVISFAVFYATQDARFCPWCHYINCINYLPDLCSASE